MGDATFADGNPQPLYFPPGHERAGVFKGMARILEEQGFLDASKLRANARTSNARVTRRIVAVVGFYILSQTLHRSSQYWKSQAKDMASKSYFCQNSIVS